ncbi:MAG TPA: SDR family oxidoreductase [Candidatus Cybelea sp.]|nr:SDR family oxidoreductase [Candidatus Cybelea sp.]
MSKAPISKALALITGGTGGIGRAIAAALPLDAYDVIAAARHAPQQPLPPGVAFRACDVSDAAEVRALFAGITSDFGRLDALVCAAGIAGTNSLGARDDDTLWRAIVATNLDGTYHCCKAALPLLPDGSGRIVTIASTLALFGVPDQTAYTAAKHGVLGFTRALALALAPRRIPVNAVCPGWVRTDMAERRFRELGIDASIAAKGTPTGRITEPGEVAGVVRHLLSAAGGDTTGRAIVIDGGAISYV